MLTLEIEGETAQEGLGRDLARLIEPPCTIHLQGDLGTGKTTLVRGFLRGLGYQGNVKSPTYTLLEPYELDGRNCYHFDLYRLADPGELEYLGVQDLLDQQAILLVEWPERASGALPPPDITVQLKHQGNARILHFDALTNKGKSVLTRLESTHLAGQSH